MKKPTKTPTRRTLTLNGEVVRMLSIAPTELHHVVAGANEGFKPVSKSCGTTETSWV